jgi:hypothetical protein
VLVRVRFAGRVDAAQVRPARSAVNGDEQVQRERVDLVRIRRENGDIQGVGTLARQRVRRRLGIGRRISVLATVRGLPDAQKSLVIIRSLIATRRTAEGVGVGVGPMIGRGPHAASARANPSARGIADQQTSIRSMRRLTSPPVRTGCTGRDGQHQAQREHTETVKVRGRDRSTHHRRSLLSRLAEAQANDHGAGSLQVLPAEVKPPQKYCPRACNRVPVRGARTCLRHLYTVRHLR